MTKDFWGRLGLTGLLYIKQNEKIVFLSFSSLHLPVTFASMFELDWSDFLTGVDHGGGEEGQPLLPLPRYLLPSPASYPYTIGEQTI